MTVESAIERLYTVFEAYPAPKTIHGCPCCVTDEARASLHRRPLTELEWDDLGVYTFKAISTFGTLANFKHFLPRILELAATEPGTSLWGLEIVVGKLNYGEWESWPDAEKRTVHDFLSAWAGEVSQALPESEGEKWDWEEACSALSVMGIEI